MDAVMAERVNKLARSLKDLHLAASMDEAYARAEEILLGGAVSKEAAVQEKTINEIMGQKEASPQQSKPEQNCVVEEVIIDSHKETASVDKKPEENP